MKALAFIAVALTLVVVPAALADNGPGKDQHCKTKPSQKRGCARLQVYTSGAGAGGVVAWMGPDTIAYQDQYGQIFRATDTTGALDLISSSSSLWYNATSPDGTKLAFTHYDQSTGSFSVQTVPTATLATPTTVASGASISGPVWKADSQRIAFADNATGGGIEWVSAAGGSPTVVIPADGSQRWVISYRADGSILVAQTDPFGGNGQLISVTESGAQTVLATDVYAPTASRDGSTIVYATAAGDVKAVSASGGAPVSLGLTGLPFGLYSASFSRGGTRVVLSFTDATYHQQAWVVGVDGSGLTRLPFNAASVDWAPGDATLAMGGFDVLGPPAFATSSPAGANLTELASGFFSALAYSADGSKVAMVDNIGGSPELAVYFFG